MRVLAVDDDPNDLRYIRDTLFQAGYAPVVTDDPEEAVRLMESERPQLALLDLMLPDTDGIEQMQAILAVADVPVIFLSAYGREEVVARAFEMGAVDYVVMPFSATELTARIGAALRRRVTVDPSETLRAGRPDRGLRPAPVTLAGRQVQLTPTEYGILAELAAHAGRVLTHEHLLERVWGGRGGGSLRPLRTMVSKLRRKLGDDADNPTFIFTEPGWASGCPGGEELRTGDRQRLPEPR